MALDFLNKMSGSLASASKDIGKVAKNKAEILRLQNEIRANEARVQEHYIEIGKRYYEIIKDDPPEEYVYLAGCVRKLEERIADDQASIKSLRGTKTCPECGAQVDWDAVCCQSCGTKIGG